MLMSSFMTSVQFLSNSFSYFWVGFHQVRKYLVCILQLVGFNNILSDVDSQRSYLFGPCCAEFDLVIAQKLSLVPM